MPPKTIRKLSTEVAVAVLGAAVPTAFLFGIIIKLKSFPEGNIFSIELGT
jgi:hypothetical protein